MNQGRRNFMKSLGIIGAVPLIDITEPTIPGYNYMILEPDIKIKNAEVIYLENVTQVFIKTPSCSHRSLEIHRHCMDQTSCYYLRESQEYRLFESHISATEKIRFAAFVDGHEIAYASDECPAEIINFRLISTIIRFKAKENT